MSVFAAGRLAVTAVMLLVSAASALAQSDDEQAEKILRNTSTLTSDQQLVVLERVVVTVKLPLQRANLALAIARVHQGQGDLDKAYAQYARVATDYETPDIYLIGGLKGMRETARTAEQKRQAKFAFAKAAGLPWPIDLLPHFTEAKDGPPPSKTEPPNLRDPAVLATLVKAIKFSRDMRSIQSCVWAHNNALQKGEIEYCKFIEGALMPLAEVLPEISGLELQRMIRAGDSSFAEALRRYPVASSQTKYAISCLVAEATRKHLYTETIRLGEEYLARKQNRDLVWGSSTIARFAVLRDLQTAYRRVGDKANAARVTKMIAAEFPDDIHEEDRTLIREFAGPDKPLYLVGAGAGALAFGGISTILYRKFGRRVSARGTA